jgi:RND family efflux transporter MFP subunit
VTRTADRLATLSALLALALAAGCHRPEPAPEPDTSAEAPPLTVVKPARKTLSHHIDQPGEIQAFEQAPLYARITGYVSKVHKDIGDPVEKDDILAEVSVPEKDEELAQKKALVTQASAQVDQARKRHEAASAALKSAGARVKEAEASKERVVAERRRAESQYQRLKSSRSVVPTETVEEARLGADAARAAVAEVEAKVTSAEAAKAESKANESQAEADIAVAQARLRVYQADERRMAALVAYAKLRAPFAGFVTGRGVDAGHLVQPAPPGGGGKPVFMVSRIDPVRIFVDVPEEDAVLITDRTPAKVRVQALKGESFEGHVRRSAWALDPKARTLRTEIDLPNPGGRLRPGMYAFARITVTGKNVLAVPASAVVVHGEEAFCFLLREGKAVRTPVRVGLREGKFVQVVVKRKPGKKEAWEAFTGEEEVIANPPPGLADGQAVTATRP